MVIVVPVPHGADGELVTSTDLDGEPVLVHAVRRALELGIPVLVLPPAEGCAAVAGVLSRAGLGARVPVAPARSRDAGGLAAAVAEGWPASSGPTALLVHDPLCPLAPSSHLLAVLDRARGTDGSWTATAGMHPVTDTVKAVHPDGSGSALGGTVDRESLRMVTTPVVVPADRSAVVTATGGAPGLVRQLREHAEVTLVASPPLARRVHDRSGLDLVLGLRAVAEPRAPLLP